MISPPDVLPMSGCWPLIGEDPAFPKRENHLGAKRSKHQTRMWDAVMEAREAALNAIEPGTFVDAAARDVFNRHGFSAQFLHVAAQGVSFAAADANSCRGCILRQRRK